MSNASSIRLNFNLKKMNKSSRFGERQRACERVLSIVHKPNLLFFILLCTLRSAYWCRQLAMQFASYEVDADRWTVILNKIRRHEIYIECFIESPIAPPRLFLLGCDVPEISIYWLMPTQREDIVSIELAANYGLLRFLEDAPWYQHEQVHPHTLLYFDLKPGYAFSAKQKEMLSTMILLALMRGMMLIANQSEWTHPLLTATYARVDSVMPKLLLH